MKIINEADMPGTWGTDDWLYPEFPGIVPEPSPWTPPRLDIDPKLPVPPSPGLSPDPI